MEDWVRPLLVEAKAVSTIILVAFVTAFLVRRALNALVSRMRFPRIAFTPVDLLLRWLIVVVATLLVAGRFIELTGLWAALTTILAAVAIGFVAMWSVLSNALCTFILILSKPFGIGDEVAFPGEEVRGRVVDLTLLYTTLETHSGEFFQIPNNMFFQRVIRCRRGPVIIPLEEQLQKKTPTRGEPPATI